MKKTIKSAVLFLLAAIMVFSLVACEENTPEISLWDSATHKENTVVGEGSKEVLIDIEAEGKKITLTVKTDKATLGEALYELELINDASFFDVLDGMKADYSKDNAYWAFYQGETMLPYGVNDAEISGGEHFRFVYTKL